MYGSISFLSAELRKNITIVSKIFIEVSRTAMQRGQGSIVSDLALKLSNARIKPVYFLCRIAN